MQLAGATSAITSTTKACAPPRYVNSHGLCVAGRSAASMPGPGHTAWPVLMLLGVGAVVIAVVYIRFRWRRRHTAAT